MTQKIEAPSVTIRRGEIIRTRVRSFINGAPPDGTYYQVDAPTLYAENERLREALREIAEGGEAEYGTDPDYRARDEIANIARAALTEGGVS